MRSTVNALVRSSILFLIAICMFGCQPQEEETEVAASTATAEEQASEEAPEPEAATEATEPEAATEATEPEAATEAAEPETATGTDDAPTADTPAREIAMFDVPDSSATAVGSLVAAVGSIPGLVSAEVSEETGQFLITFTPGVTNPPAILAALVAVEPAVTLAGVSRAEGTSTDAPGHNCGGCPMRNSCNHGNH